MPLGILAPSNSSSLDPVAAAQGGSDRHSNALVPHPIAKLPVELLEQIFIEHARDTYKPGSIYADVTVHQLRPEWIDATYVCRLWREICLHCPRLWTCIPTTLSRKWILTFLERSRKQPLIVDLMINHLHIDDLRAVFSANTFRIKELYVGVHFFETDAQLRQCWNILTDSAPLLESLIIDTFFVNSYAIPDTLFSRDTPRLCRLGLDCGAAVGPTSPLLGNLRHLDIRDIHVGQLLTVLQKTPFLESLEVRMPSEIPDSELPAAVLNLPYLSWLYIEAGHYGNMTALFKRLQMPSTVRVQFRATTNDEIDDDSFKMLNSTRDCLQWIHEALGHLYVVFDIKPPRQWCMACYPFPRDHIVNVKPLQSIVPPDNSWRRPDEVSCSASFSLLMDFRVYNEIFAQMISDVQIITSQMASMAADVHALRLGLNLSKYPSHIMSELYKDTLTALMPETWSPFLPLMSGTRTLILAGNAIVGVLWALVPSRDDGDSSRPLRFPSSPHSLSLNAVLNPGTLISLGLPAYIRRHSSNAMDTLDLFLSHRLELGMGLRELVICDDVRYRKEHTESLRRYVETIIYPALNLDDETR